MTSSIAKFEKYAKPKKSNQLQPKLLPPEFLILPDGRQIRTRDIIKKVTKVQVVNLRKPREKSLEYYARKAQKKHMYTFEDREWIAINSPADIARKFNIRIATATDLKQQCEDLMIYIKSSIENNRIREEQAREQQT